ncbi:amino acid transporter [Penicillium macrosclerotiorum]|uniref:amino acid transporter n=1 Tax=Penicillium macrosclerotiorum TaxID=303699 RepID=UPI002548C90A|nr:amino acid transporter [Penicillium macrosclerotiorum]KAJ5678945.1 amino acid transporter [Penicillium macrosclerotiorum]
MADTNIQEDKNRRSEAQLETKGLGEALDFDEAILRAQGHRVQLERSFSWLGALGLAFSIVNSWLTYAACFGVTYSYGGGPVAIFSPIISATVQWIMLLGVAELSSAFPSSGGQYHFTYMVAPEGYKAFAAYIVGSINVVAWWQRIENMTETAMFLSILGFALVVIVCLVMGRGSYHPSSLVEFRSTSGWTTGPGWMLAIGNGEYAFAAAGACVHIAEEIPNPSRKIPLVMFVFPALHVLLEPRLSLKVISPFFSDMEAVQNSFLPSLELFYQGTGSKAAAACLQAYLTILYYTCVPSQWITSSRMTWAFSRDNGLPFSNYWSEVDKKRNIPVRATLLSAGFCVVYGLLYIASTQAFNSIINTAVLMLNITYTVPQAILMVQGRHILPSRPLNLGRSGYLVHLFSVLWLILSGIFFCFPTTNPPTLGNMN